MLETIILIIILFLSVIFHEYAHGWAAYQLGDPTAKLAGRLTLNPLKHIDPIGYSEEQTRPRGQVAPGLLEGRAPRAPLARGVFGGLQQSQDLSTAMPPHKTANHPNVPMSAAALSGGDLPFSR